MMSLCVLSRRHHSQRAPLISASPEPSYFIRARAQFVTSLRTPIGKFRGGLKDMHAEVRLSLFLSCLPRETVERLLILDACNVL